MKSGDYSHIHEVWRKRVVYGKDEGSDCLPDCADAAQQEIKAVEDEGFQEWILWNPSSTYTEAALAPN